MKNFGMIMVIIGAIIFCYLGFKFNFRGRMTYEFNLPEYENLKSININYNDEIMVINGYEAMKDILYNIKESREYTSIESINDTPNVDNYIKVIFHDENKDYVVYVYEKDNKYYFEQPYNGIYRVDFDEYDCIYKYIE